MLISPEFKQVVELYRQLNRPELVGDRFSGELLCLNENKGALENLWSSKKFDLEISLDDETFDTESEESFPQDIANKNINVSVSLPQNENGKFYKNIRHWIASSDSLSRGSLTPNTYLIDDNLLVDDSEQSADLSCVIAACNLINKLGEIAHYHDEKMTSGGPFRLVFVVPGKADKSFYPVVLETLLSAEILGYQPNVGIIENIMQEQSDNRIHALERIATFRMALAEIIKNAPSDKEAFVYLVQHWDEVLDSFQKSWESYINGFSFQKLKAEIAEKQAGFSQKMTDVVASLSAKLFSLPITIASVALVEKQGSELGNWFYVAGSLLTTYLVFSSIKIQEKNLENIDKSCILAFSEYQDKESLEFSGIQAELKIVVNSLKEMVSNLNGVLRLYRWLSWIPVVTSITFILYKSHIHWACLIDYILYRFLY
ncbi:hypothetical protein JCM14076_09070 [Methylosoma difficile]